MQWYADDEMFRFAATLGNLLRKFVAGCPVSGAWQVNNVYGTIPERVARRWRGEWELGTFHAQAEGWRRARSGVGVSAT
jgi:hypothetical protein